MLCLQMVGPLLTDDAKPLPADMTAFLDKGLTHGHPAVYVSMGTWARLTKDELIAMGAALSALPNLVLWKLDPLHMPGAVQMHPPVLLMTSTALCIE